MAPGPLPAALPAWGPGRRWLYCEGGTLRTRTPPLHRECRPHPESASSWSPGSPVVRKASGGTVPAPSRPFASLPPGLSPSCALRTWGGSGGDPRAGPSGCRLGPGHCRVGAGGPSSRTASSPARRLRVAVRPLTACAGSTRLSRLLRLRAPAENSEPLRLGSSFRKLQSPGPHLGPQPGDRTARNLWASWAPWDVGEGPPPSGTWGKDRHPPWGLRGFRKHLHTSSNPFSQSLRWGSLWRSRGDEGTPVY
ncbi:uncharacterized protein LOC114901840 [Monodon monoceros]|uniref:uncharacterized protein LOC114901840 n=1 Tax=Monodon monoceros TaxID=40151 RepID=UPI0010F91D38|nr:uncharacterized protein LOC114901840 [Monodon monoceros]